MKNCLVAQSGGPTSVINASFIGLLEESKQKKYYDHVYAGINGIEGIINKHIIDISDLCTDTMNDLKYTPSSALGSCRYKLKDFKESTLEYEKIFKIFDDFHIESFFYIGGNDSMDTVHRLSAYAKACNKNVKILGIPKTIDNDLVLTDHTPGFGSAAKFISTVTLECFCDASVYSDNGILIIETMGRDTGWLTASAALARINNTQAADFIYLPETHFSRSKFLEDINKKYKEQKRVIIVASEGLKNENGIILSQEENGNTKDKFGHVQLGGVSSYLKNMIIENGITKRVRNIELSILQRCAMHCSSKTDIDESLMVGREALKYSIQGITGKMVGIRRLSNSPYSSDTILIDASNVANNVKYFPLEWINEEQNNINELALQYMSPLIEGTPEFHMVNGLPNFITLNKNNWMV